MTKKNTNLLKNHGIKKGDQVPLHVTNILVRELPKRTKTAPEKIYEQMPLDEKIKAKKGKLSKTKRVV